MRVLEDYARFVLDDSSLCSSLKALRHDFQQYTSAFVGRAILHRDTPNDVGTSSKTTTEASRDDLSHVVTAAGKRLGEALRTIEEYLKIEAPSNASQIERLRYRFYDLEQQIARTLHTQNAQLAAVRLCVLVTQSLCKRPWLEAAEQAILGGADCIQLREKEMESGELLHRAKQLVDLCRAHHVVSIINDRPDIALLAGADGVHVGQGDLPAVEVRKIVGPDKIVGVSTHHLDQVRKAVLDGANYIGVGPIFKSTTKPRDILPGLEYATQVARAELPIPAMGIAGISIDRLDQVLATGLRAVAVSGAVIAADDVRSAAREFKQRLTANEPARMSVP